MPTIDLGAPPPVTGAAGVRPHRLSLTLPELVRAAELAAVVLPFAPPAPPAGLAEVDPDESLASRGLLTGPAVDQPAVDQAVADGAGADQTLAGQAAADGAGEDFLDARLTTALRALAAPQVALDLTVDLASADGSRTAHLRVWHRQRHGAVASLATADGVVFALALFARTQWAGELARAAMLPPGLPADWRGRLQALVTDARAEAPRTVGAVTWTLEAGGWQGPAPAPRAAGGEGETPAPPPGHIPPTAALDPDDLADALAPLVAEAGR